MTLIKQLSSYQSIVLLLTVVSVTVLSAHGSSHEDVRCKCVCPDPARLLDKTISAGWSSGRKLYIDNVSPQQCNCDWLVLPQIKLEYQNRSKEFCPRCECKYESRNLSTIKWVVVGVCTVIAVLIVYMSVLLAIESIPLTSRRLYQEHVNEEVSLDEPGSNASPFNETGDSTRPRTTSNVLDRVNYKQTKWQQQIQEQRRNIYDKHTMLN
jgi:hypothetical protein